MELEEMLLRSIRLVCRTNKLGWAIFLILLAALPVFGQERTPRATAPTFTARTQLVLVPAIVRDKSGEHIAKLKKEDFTILENGIPQKIAVFEELIATTRQLRRTPPNQGEFRNSLEGKAEPGRLTIILLDTINTAPSYQARAREDLVKFLLERPPTDEPMALLTLGNGGVSVIHDFATDPRVLAAALKKARGTLPAIEESELADALFKNAGDAWQAYLAGVEKFSRPDPERAILRLKQRMVILKTLEALQLLAEAVEGIPGRKSLLWVSAGFPFSINSILDVPPELAYGDPGQAASDVAGLLSQYEHTWQLLNHANMAVYPVDARGLLNPLSVDASVSGAPPPTYGSAAMGAYRDTLLTFRTVADMTGGRPCYDQNDLDLCFQRAVEDSASYYLLGYYLERTKTRPGWRKLEVKVQHPGARVRTRQGFLISAVTENPETTKTTDLALAMRSPLDYTGLPIVARWTRTSGTAQKHVGFEIFVSPPLPGLVDERDSNHVSVEFVAVAKTPTGEAAGQVTKKVEGKLNPATLALIKQAGLKFENSFELPPGEYTVRFVVRDNLTGRMGSVSAPLTVAP